MHLFLIDYITVMHFFAGLTKQVLNKLQLIQNAAARVLTKTKRFEHITSILFSFHCLPVKQRIDFEILLSVLKSMNVLAPSYVVDMLTGHTPDRSSSKVLLIIPRINSKSVNHELRSATTVSSFKSRLKTYIFFSF